ncbi:MAG: CoA transferase [Acidimicrobiales bacterium]
MTPAPDEPPRLLDGLVVADLLPPELGMTGDILARLGATVVRVIGGPTATSRFDRRWCQRASVWAIHETQVGAGTDDEQRLLARADVVLRWSPEDERDPTKGSAGSGPGTGGDRAEGPVIVEVSPFGSSGPRAGWRAGDLGVAAASGNLWATGQPDRPPVRCAAPLGAIHVGAEAAFAALCALAGGSPRADVSMAETMVGACLGAPANLGAVGDRGQRTGDVIGLTREIWPCRDGWVSFGLRGGPARVPSLRRLAELASARGDRRLEGVAWETYNPRSADPEFLAQLTAAVAELLRSLTLDELEQLAEEGVLVAPVLDAAAIARSPQLEGRRFFDAEGRPSSFAAARRPGGAWHWLGGPGPRDEWRRSGSWGAAGVVGGAPWDGTTIVELGSGVAGPLVGRYFAEQGARVVRVESATRPDFLRLYALGPENPHGLEGSTQYVWTNTAKLGLSLDLKDPEGRRLLLELIRRADAVIENFTPGTLDRLGLGYEVLAEIRPDLVLLSTSFNGQTGPRRHEAGFGALGSAASGFNNLTGWPDGPPIGPATTITDSLNPRFAAAALAAALLRRRRTGEGFQLDLAQVETALYALSPWLAWCRAGGTWSRGGNLADGAVPHGVYRCAGDDRWVAVAVWSDDEWQSLRDAIGWEGPALDTLGERVAAAEQIEAALEDYTARRTADEVADRLQELGVEAVPVADYCDVAADPTLGARAHFVAQDHPVLGPVLAERSGYRLEPDLGGYEGASPTLGGDNRRILRELCGVAEDQLDPLLGSPALR